MILVQSLKLMRNLSLNLIKRNKFSYAFGKSDEILSPLTIGQVIENRSTDSADTIACVSVHQNIIKTYKQLNEDVNRLAKALKSIGCERGDRVGIWSPNCYEWVVTQYATAKIGTIMVNVNPGYQAKELEYCLNLVGCHTLISFQKFKSTNYCDILESLEPDILKDCVGTQVKSQRIPTLKNVIMIDTEEDKGYAPKNMIRFNDLISVFNGENDFEICADFDQSINIQFTSGTTGRPKGATLTHHNLIQNAYFVGKRALEELTDKPPVICLPPPLYHCFGSVVGSLMVSMNKGTLVLPSPVHNPIETLKAIQEFKCDMVYGTPTMFIDLLDSGISKFNTKSIKRAMMSGSSCPQQLLKSVQKSMPTCEHILIPYGTTECSPAITITSIRDSEKHRHESVGRPIDHIEVKICDINTGAVKPIGEAGEVCSRGHNSFVGYWNQSEKTAEVVDKNRWYHTGDVGVMDESGYISINSRIKDMIIRGGENIYPLEIENFFLTNNSVADVQVVGIDDERLGEEMVAFIKLKKNYSSDRDSLRNFAKGKISHFKIPKHYEFVDDFPRTVTGKIEKFKLKIIAQNIYNKK